ncbi:MAG: 3-hexulose-6-phosphate synthase [Chloroflexota bacterium]
MTKLQVALDGDLKLALEILSQVNPFIDIAEVGTPLIFREGMYGVRHIHTRYPRIKILADLKIMDAGEEEASIAFENGASFVTVLGVANLQTIEGALKAAQQYQKEIVVDMMQVDNLVQRANDLLSLGCDILCVHTAYDLQSKEASPYRALAHLRESFPNGRLAIAGGVKAASLNAILPYKPEIVVVGGGICRADDPGQAAKTLKTMIRMVEG